MKRNTETSTLGQYHSTFHDSFEHISNCSIFLREGMLPLFIRLLFLAKRKQCTLLVYIHQSPNHRVLSPHSNWSSSVRGIFCNFTREQPMGTAVCTVSNKYQLATTAIRHSMRIYVESCWKCVPHKATSYVLGLQAMKI